jgi:hypothetical protein
MVTAVGSAWRPRAGRSSVRDLSPARSSARRASACVSAERARVRGTPARAAQRARRAHRRRTSTGEHQSKRPEKKRRGIALIDELGEKISALAAEDAVQPPLPTGVGNELMVAFSLPPSRLVGDIKRALEAAIESGELEPHLESGEYVEFVRQNKERFGLGG